MLHAPPDADDTPTRAENPTMPPAQHQLSNRGTVRREGTQGSNGRSVDAHFVSVGNERYEGWVPVDSGPGGKP